MRQGDRGPPNPPHARNDQIVVSVGIGDSAAIFLVVYIAFVGVLWWAAAYTTKMICAEKQLQQVWPQSDILRSPEISAGVATCCFSLGICQS